MSIFIKKDKKRAALEKEYASVLKKETQLKQSAMKTTAPRWKTDLEKKVPEKVYRSLETAFSKASPRSCHPPVHSSQQNQGLW